jgi:non-heme chloroperoxidase
MDGSAIGGGWRWMRRRLATGPVLHCAEIGDPLGQIVLFLHGYSDSSFSASPLGAHVPPGVRLVAPDQRGHGRSDRPHDGYDMATLAADATALLDTLGCARATVVGHSMGGLVAQRLAIDAPARVASLVLVDTAAAPANAATHELAAAVAAFDDAGPVPRDFVEAFQASCLARPLAPDFFARVVEESLRLPARVWRALAPELLRFDSRPDLARIATATRVVWGDRDAVFDRAAQDALCTGIAGATLTVYAGTGHTPHWEEPERFAQDLFSTLVDDD